MIQADFQGTDRTVPAELRRKMPGILEAVRMKMNMLDLQLQQKIQGEKLQGQVLQHRTGKLAASIRVEEATVTGDIVEGAVEGAGGVAFYGRVQNYGGDRAYDIVPVNKKALAFFGGGGPGPMMNKNIARGIIQGFNAKSAAARAGAHQQFGNLGGIVVKKVVHPPLPARNFMESTAEEFKPQMTKGLSDAVVAGMRKPA